MQNNKRMPLTNSSEAVLFLLRGAKKRRSMAAAKAMSVQGEVGASPRLATVK